VEHSKELDVPSDSIGTCRRIWIEIAFLVLEIACQEMPYPRIHVEFANAADCEEAITKPPGL
jgi:hypothetical protein